MKRRIPAILLVVGLIGIFGCGDKQLMGPSQAGAPQVPATHHPDTTWVDSCYTDMSTPSRDEPVDVTPVRLEVGKRKEFSNCSDITCALNRLTFRLNFINTHSDRNTRPPVTGWAVDVDNDNAAPIPGTWDDTNQTEFSLPNEDGTFHHHLVFRNLPNGHRFRFYLVWGTDFPRSNSTGVIDHALALVKNLLPKTGSLSVESNSPMESQWDTNVTGDGNLKEYCSTKCIRVPHF